MQRSDLRAVASVRAGSRLARCPSTGKSRRPTAENLGRGLTNGKPLLCASTNQKPRRQVGQKVLRQENKKLTPARRAGSSSNDPQSASFPRAGHGICLGQVVFPSAATYLYLPLSPAEFSSHARTSRSHSLRWPRRLFLKTYKPFIFAQIHGVEATGPHAWTRFGSGKYGGNASALLGIKHDRHRNVAGGW